MHMVMAMSQMYIGDKQEPNLGIGIKTIIETA